MNRILKTTAIALCLSPLLALAQSIEDITDLILVTGQSNVRGSQTDYDPTLDATHPRVFAFTTTKVQNAYSTGGTWQLADLHQAWDVDGWHPGNGSINDPARSPYNNFAFSFAKKVAESDPSRIVGIVIASAPGEGIQHWDPNGDFTGPSQPADSRAFAQVIETQALAAVNAQGVKSTFDAVLWHQGETDWQANGTSDPDVLNYYANDPSYDPASDANYYPNKLNSLINRFQTSSWFETGKPFIAGETKKALVNARIIELNSDGNRWTGAVEAEGLSTRDAGTHFDAEGLRTLGERYALMYLDMTTSSKTNLENIIPTAISPASGSELLEPPTEFTWQKIQGASYYDLFVYDRTTESIVFRDSNIPSTHCVADLCSYSGAQASLPIGKNHVWRVRAGNDSGYSAFSYSSFHLIGSKPSIPIALSPANESNLTESPTVFTWQIVQGATHYDLFVYDRTSKSIVFRDSNVPSTHCVVGSCSYSGTQASLPIGKNHVWRVRAGNDSSYSAFSYSSFHLIGSKPSMPIAVSPANGSLLAESPTKFTWQEVQGATHYDLFVYDRTTASIVFRNTNIQPTSCITDICTYSDVDVTLPTGINHVWRVRAGNDSGYSKFYYSSFDLVVSEPSNANSSISSQQK